MNRSPDVILCYLKISEILRCFKVLRFSDRSVIPDKSKNHFCPSEPLCKRFPTCPPALINSKPWRRLFGSKTFLKKRQMQRNIPADVPRVCVLVAAFPALQKAVLVGLGQWRVLRAVFSEMVVVYYCRGSSGFRGRIRCFRGGHGDNAVRRKRLQQTANPIRRWVTIAMNVLETKTHSAGVKNNNKKINK